MADKKIRQIFSNRVRKEDLADIERVKGVSAMGGQAGSSERKYGYLERFPTEQLEEILRTATSLGGEDEFLDAVAEVLMEREQNVGDQPDVEAAWREFQTRYSTPDGKGQSLYPDEDVEREPAGRTAPQGVGPLPSARSVSAWKRGRRLLGTIAATIALTFALMVGVQAAGVDVFGALARWTSVTFRISKSSKQFIEIRDAIQNALDEVGIEGDFIPLRYPDGAELCSVEVYDEVYPSVWATLICPNNRSFFYSVDKYDTEEKLYSQIYEVKTESVEEYIVGGQSYYLFLNSDSVTAMWTKGTVLQQIWGDLTTDEIKNMINSIGG